MQGPFGNGGHYSPARWGAQLGATAVFFFAAPVLFILTSLGVSSFAPWHFVMFEGVFGAALGITLTPLIVWRAIVDR